MCAITEMYFFFCICETNYIQTNFTIKCLFIFIEQMKRTLSEYFQLLNCIESHRIASHRTESFFNNMHLFLYRIVTMYRDTNRIVFFMRDLHPYCQCIISREACPRKHRFVSRGPYDMRSKLTLCLLYICLLDPLCLLR